MCRLVEHYLILSLLLSACSSSTITIQNSWVESPQSNIREGNGEVYVPGGEFEIWEDEGDSSSSHTVYIDAFYIEKFEVTNELYIECVNEGGCTAPKIPNSLTRSEYYGNPEFDNYPVVFVNWFMATSFCEWRGTRLPTEAEWEKAARGIDGRKYPWGEYFDSNYANIGKSMEDTTPVGFYENGKSVYGAYDMVGNLWEWVSNWYGDDYYYTSPYENPKGPASGELRVIRGGSFVDSEYDGEFSNTDPKSPTYRFGWYPERSNHLIGFRCAHSP